MGHLLDAHLCDGLRHHLQHTLHIAEPSEAQIQDYGLDLIDKLLGQSGKRLQEAQWFPGPQIWYHAIKLKKDAPSTILGKVYALTQVEQKALQEFLSEHL